MILSEQALVRDTTHTNLFELTQWCRLYHKRNKYPCSTFERFAIGIYQISQGIGWNSNNIYREYESFAASAIHFMCVAESLNLNLYQQDLKRDLIELETESLDYRRLLVHISAAQQMVFYYHKSYQNNYSRKSRYNPDKLKVLLNVIITSLFRSIPQDKRSEAIEQATSIMTKKL